jgi:hypothetical protein
VSRVQRVIKDSITTCSHDDVDSPSDYLTDCVYLHAEVDKLLLYLNDQLTKVQDILTQKLNMSIDSTERFPNASFVSPSLHDRGRPSISLDLEVIIFLRSMRFKWGHIAEMIGVSRSTLYRKCKAFGEYELEDHNFLSYSDVLPVVQEIKAEFPDVGERLLMGRLHARRIHCTRETLRRVIHGTDPINTLLRWNANIISQSYSLPSLSNLWHIANYNTLFNW